MDLWCHIVSRLPFEWASYTFMQYALLAVLVMAPTITMVGCLVVSNQMSFFSEAIGHSTLTGVAIGAIVGLADPTPAIILLAISMAFVVSSIRRISAASIDTVVGLTMAFAVALGVAILSRNGGFPRYNRYLVGDILTVTRSELTWFVVLGLLLLVVWIFFYNRLLIVSFDRALARTRGIRPWLHESMFSALIAVVVAVAIPWVGLLVINALLVLPAASSRNVAWNNSSYHWIALAVALFSSVIGLAASFHFGTSAGATIVLVAILCFGGTVAIRQFRRV